MSPPRSWPRLAGRGCRRTLLALVALAVAGCAVFRAEPLDVPPGQRLVLGRVDIAQLGLSPAALEIRREDGTYRHELSLDQPRTTFVITLPPGRYQIVRVWPADNSRSSSQATFWLRVTFEVVNAPAVYVGTLQLDKVSFGGPVRAAVRDDYDRTVSEVRGRHSDLPAVVARSLMQPN